MLQHGTAPVRIKLEWKRFRIQLAAGTLIWLTLVTLAILACATAAVYIAFGNDAKRSRSALIKVTAAPPLVLPQSDPEALRPLTRRQAMQWNNAIPIAKTSNPSASSFEVGAVTSVDFSRSLDCMTAAVYYEAASESDDGQSAVAQIILNRVRHPAFPHTVCGVVYQGYERRTGCQFSFTCDGAMSRPRFDKAWRRARVVAARALKGSVYAPVGWATHYHTDWVAPYWSTTLVKTAQIGTHIFYRWPGGWGMPRAFTARYAGGESSLTLPIETGSDSERLTVSEDVVTVAAGERPVLTSNRVLASPTTSAEAIAPVPDRAVATSERPIFRGPRAPVTPTPPPLAPK